MICIKTFVFAFAILTVVNPAAVVVKRQADNKDESMGPLELLGGVLSVLGGAADTLQKLAGISQQTLDPILETAGKAGEIIVQAPVVDTIEERRDQIGKAFVDNVRSTAVN